MKTTSRKATPARTASILAIDLGKYKSVICVHEGTNDSNCFEAMIVSPPQKISVLMSSAQQ